MFKSLLISVFILSAVSFTIGAPAIDEALLEQYQARWGTREAAARTAYARQTLVSDLLKAAEAKDVSPDMTVLLCNRAYSFAKQDRESYVLGAKAAELMAKTNPDLTLTALLNVRQLYQLAYNENRAKNLGMGIGLARATMRAAEQRMIDVETKRGTGEIDIDQAIRDLKFAESELKSAQRMAKSVLTRATQTAKQYERRNAALAAQLNGFVAEHEDLPGSFDEMLSEIRPRLAGYADIEAIGERYESTKSKVEAQQLARIYLLQFDSPTRALKYATVGMEPADQSMLKLAATDDADLAPANALKLGQWYYDLSQKCTDAQKPTALMRARRYFLLCDKQFKLADSEFAAANSGLQKTHSALRGVDIALPVKVLRASDGQVATAPPTRPPVRPVRPVRPTPTPTPTPTVDNGSSSSDGSLASTGGSGGHGALYELPDGGYVDAAGRLVCICQQCFLKFSPKKGASKTKCQSCTGGHGSIFDFGD